MQRLDTPWQYMIVTKGCCCKVNFICKRFGVRVHAHRERGALVAATMRSAGGGLTQRREVAG